MTHTETQNQVSPTNVTVDDARVSIELAKHEFADTDEKHGRKVALATFNRRVSRYSNSFTDLRLRKFAYVLGEAMSGKTHSYQVSNKRLRELWKDKYGETKSERQIWRYVERFEKLGLITVVRAKQDETDENPGMNRSHEYTVHFDRVMVRGEVVPHDFFAPLPPKNGNKDDNKDDKELARKDARKVAAKDDTKLVREDVPYSLNTSSISSHSSTSSPQADAASRARAVDAEQYSRCIYCSAHPRDCKRPDKHLAKNYWRQ